MFKTREVPSIVFLCSLLSIYALFDRYLSDPIGIFLLICLLMVIAYRRAGRPLRIPKAIAFVLVMLVIFTLNVAVFVLKVNQELALVYFLTVLILAKSFVLQKINDYSQLMFLSVLSILAAGAYNPTGQFPIIVFLFILVGGYAVYKTHLLTEVLAHRRIKKTLPALVTYAEKRSWIRPFVVACTITCIVALIIYSFMPRQSPNLNLSDTMGNQQAPSTGFSQEITLGQMVNILQDKTSVLRVKYKQNEKQKNYNLALYLRGMVSNQYVQLGNSWKWIESHSKHFTELKSASSLSTSVPIQTGKLKPENQILWRISFEQAVSSNLFLIDRPVSVATNQPVSLYYYSRENILSAGTQNLPKGFTYEILTEQVPNDVPPRKNIPSSAKELLKMVVPEHLGRRSRHSPVSAEPEQQTQAVDIQPFLPIAQEIVKDLKPEATVSEKAQKIETWLRSSFKYTLDNTDVNRSVEPVMDFLKRRKHGHCEYFASAMVLLARSLGMDARVVVGYKGGLYNSFGDFFVVRHCDAHAWAEIFVPGRGWTTFDPTPGARDDFIHDQDAAAFKWVWDLVDMMQYSWADKLSNLGTDLRKQILNNFQQKTHAYTIQNPLADVQKWSVSRSINALINLIKGQKYESVGLQILHSFLVIMAFALVILFLRISVAVAGIIWTSIRQFLHRKWEQRFGSVWFCPVDFYRKTLLGLASHGLARYRTETAEEYARRVGKILPQIKRDVRFLTAVYLYVRFGNRVLTVKQKNKVATVYNRIQDTLAGKIPQESDPETQEA